jgi:hypothetical protein
MHRPCLLRCLTHAHRLVAAARTRCERSFLPHPWVWFINVVYLRGVLTITPFMYWFWGRREEPERRTFWKYCSLLWKMLNLLYIFICSLKKIPSVLDVGYFIFECYFDFLELLNFTRLIWHHVDHVWRCNSILLIDLSKSIDVLTLRCRKYIKALHIDCNKRRVACRVWRIDARTYSRTRCLDLHICAHFLRCRRRRSVRARVVSS